MTVTYPGNSVTRKDFTFPLGAAVLVTSPAEGRTRQPGRVTAHVKSWSDPPYVIKYDDGTSGYAETRELTYAPVVGLGASVLYYTDTRAAVITRVTRTQVTVVDVKTGPPVQDMSRDEGAYGIRPTKEPGLLDQPIPGTEQVFRLTKRGTYERRGLRLIIGHSTRYIDWRL